MNAWEIHHHQDYDAMQDHTASTDPTSSSDTQSRNIVQHDYTKSIVALKTPVLFSTNRGIYIRRTVTADSRRHPTDYTFKVVHCDLEPFQSAAVSKRVNTIGLTPETNVSTISSSTTNKSQREQQIRPKNVRFVNEQRSGSWTTTATKSDKSKFVWYFDKVYT